MDCRKSRSEKSFWEYPKDAHRPKIAIERSNCTISKFRTEVQLVLFRNDLPDAKRLEKYSAKIPRRAYADAQRSKNPNRISNKANGDYRTSKFTLKWPKSIEFNPVSIGRNRKLYLIEGVLTERGCPKYKIRIVLRYSRVPLEPKLPSKSNGKQSKSSNS